MLDITGFLIAVATRSYEAIYKWGYLGLFTINLIETASLSIFPLPTMVFVFSFGGILNPFMVGLVAGLGGGIGSLTGYILGRGFKDLAEKKYGKKLEETRKKFEKYNGLFWIALVNVTPLPDSIISVFCGVIKYDLKKFFLVTTIAKIIFALIISYSGYYSLTWIWNLINPTLPTTIPV